MLIGAQDMKNTKLTMISIKFVFLLLAIFLVFLLVLLPWLGCLAEKAQQTLV